MAKYITGSFGTFTKSELNKDKNKEKLEKKQEEIYAPGKSSRELNPYWKDGGDGLPSMNQKLNFMKPDFDFTNERNNTNSEKKGSWRKNADVHKKDEFKNCMSQNEIINTRTKQEVSSQPDEAVFLTDQQMNELAAKLVKAEILGNQSQINELKQKLDAAREARKNMPAASNDKIKENAVLLTTTDSRGLSRPLPDPKSEKDPYYGGKSKKKKVVAETHVGGKRAKYFADDDKHSLRDMVHFFINNRLRRILYSELIKYSKIFIIELN